MLESRRYEEHVTKRLGWDSPLAFRFSVLLSLLPSLFRSTHDVQLPIANFLALITGSTAFIL